MSYYALTLGGGGGSGTVTSVSWTGGIVSIATATTTPAFTIAGTSGGIVYFDSATTWASSGILAANSLVVGGGAGAAPSTVTTGTGVVTALGVNTGSAGAFVVNGGDLGTPSAGVVTNLTGTASININGTVGATTANTGTFSSTVHKGATSGTVTIAAPSVAGTQSYTLPSAVPAANGYVLSSTTAGVMSWAAAGTGSPGGSTTQVQYNNAGGFGGISGFTTDGTRVTASTTIGVGGATPSTSGSGITFPATVSLSSNANTLDDYEEGTWTPNVGQITVVGTFSSSGTYTKIGSLVYVRGIYTGSTSVAINAGSVLSSNLPFPAADLAGGGNVTNAFPNATAGVYIEISGIYSTGTIAATTKIIFGATYYTTS